MAQFTIDNHASNTSSSILQSSQISHNNLNREINEIDRNLCNVDLASQDMTDGKNNNLANLCEIGGHKKYSPFNYEGVFDS